MEQFGSNLLLSPSCLIHLFYRNKTRKKFGLQIVNSDDGLLPSVKFYHLDEITHENKQELRIWCTEANTGGLHPFMYLLVLTCFGLWYKGAMLQLVNAVYGSLSVREIVQVCHQKLAI